MTAETVETLLAGLVWMGVLTVKKPDEISDKWGEIGRRIQRQA